MQPLKIRNINEEKRETLMIDIITIFINNNDDNSNSFDLNIKKDPLCDDYYEYTSIPGRNGLYIVCDNPKYASNQYKGKIKASVITQIEELLKTLSKGQKCFPADYVKSNQIMGMPKGYFEVSYRKYGNVYFHHFYGNIKNMPDTLKEVIDLLEKEKVRML